jgi:adenylate kinase
MKGVIFGPPGAGKGTQGVFISNYFSIPLISTGQIVRDAIKNDSPALKGLKDMIAKGALVPDHAIIDIAIDRISKNDCDSGYLLDGFPRTIDQAKALALLNVRLDFVLSVEVDSEEIVRRISGRLYHPSSGRTYHKTDCPPLKEGIDDVTGEPLITRDDDQPESIKKRLSVYTEQTEPVLSFYKNDITYRPQFLQVNGMGSIDLVKNRIQKLLGTHFSSRL